MGGLVSGPASVGVQQKWMGTPALGFQNLRPPESQENTGI